MASDAEPSQPTETFRSTIDLANRSPLWRWSATDQTGLFIQHFRAYRPTMTEHDERCLVETLRSIEAEARQTWPTQEDAAQATAAPPADP